VQKKRIELVVGCPLLQDGRDYILQDGRRVFINYSKPHHGGGSFYLGLPNRLQPKDALVLLLGDKDLVFPEAEMLLRYKDAYPRSSNRRPIPNLKKIGDKFVLRIERLGLTISLDDRVGAYEELKTAPMRRKIMQAGFGRPYRDVSEAGKRAAPEPFTVDPDLIDRGTRGHARTLNELAAYLRTLGVEPLEPAPGDPLFDLGWIHEGATHVAEIKSLSRDNQERQLRLGLGQVLRYRHLLGQRIEHVVAVLVTELEPSDLNWNELCGSLDVKLVQPPHFEGLLDR